MSNVPKWNEEREAKLTAFVGDESPVSQATVAEAAVALETTNRSISSKLRKMDYEVEPASAGHKKAFSDAQAATLQAFVTDNSGTFTYKQIAENFEKGTFTAKQIQGKILSMELTEHVAPAPKPETVKTFTDAQEVLFIKMAGENAFLEDIAKAMDKPLNSVRGKALSLLRTERITDFPKQEFTKEASKKDPLTALGDISGLTVAEIAAALTTDDHTQTERGVKVMLTRRGLKCDNHDGAARKAKAAK
jgi:hypothetical protein